MAVAITIRNVPDEVRNTLAARAAQSGRSLQEYLLLELKTMASKPTVEEIMARARARAEAEGVTLGASAILEALDETRRGL
jgi:plasmid stability protein